MSTDTDNMRGARLELSGHSADLVNISASTDGRLLASIARDGSLRIWDLSTGKQAASREWGRRVPWGFPRAVAISDDVSKLYVSDGRGRVHVLQRSEALASERVIDLCRCSWLAEFRSVLSRLVVAVVDGSREVVASCPDGSVRSFTTDSDDQPRVLFLSSRKRAPLLAAAGRICATVADDSSVVVFDVRSGTKTSCCDHSQSQPTDRITAIAISGDAACLAMGYASGHCELRAAGDLRIKRVFDSTALMIESIALSAEGFYVATVASDGLLRVWDTALGKLRLSVDLNEGRRLPMPSPTVCFTAAANVSATCGDHRIRVWPICW